MSGLLRNDGAGQAFLLVTVIGQASLPVTDWVKAHTGFMNTTTDNNGSISPGAFIDKDWPESFGPAFFEQ